MSLIRQWTQSTFFKVITLLFVLILLSIALGQISSVVYERKSSQRYAEEELAQTYVGEQAFVSPVLVVPYVEQWVEVQRNNAGKVVARYKRHKSHLLPIMASDIAINGSMTPASRYRGIFEVQFYQSALTVSGSFPRVRASQFKKQHSSSTITKGRPYLTFGLSDIRGLQGQPDTTLNSTSLAFTRGESQNLPPADGADDAEETEEAVAEAVAGADKIHTQGYISVDTTLVVTAVDDSPFAQWDNGLRAPLTGQALRDYQAGKPLQLEMAIQFAGQKSLFFSPIANETTVQLQSSWQHPSFTGSFLPTTRSVSSTGFTSTWNISSLVTTGNLLSADGDNQFGVNLIQPINTYSLSERAIKYGFLFVALTLLVVFMVELFRRLQLHPMQYGLVGLSISFFFLLLLALSEKVGFALAYLSAGSATVVLLGIYFSAILKHWMHGLGMAGFVALLYGTLYGLLKSEDNALLLGTLLLFGLLAGLMLMTRHVNWYALTGRKEALSNGSDSAAAADCDADG